MITNNILTESAYFPAAVLEKFIRPKLVPLAPIPQETLLGASLTGESAQPTHFFLLDELDLQALQTDQPGEPIYKRIAAAGHLKPLSAQETRSYVERGLVAKGWKNDPDIEESVFQIIHHFSEGVPRRINIICNNLLLQCFIDRRRKITGADAIASVKELTMEKPVTPGFHSEQSCPLPPQRETRAEEQTRPEPVPKECTPEQSHIPSPLAPADTAISTIQRAHFGPLNSSLPQQSKARRGEW